MPNNAFNNLNRYVKHLEGKMNPGSRSFTNSKKNVNRLTTENHAAAKGGRKTRNRKSRRRSTLRRK